MLIGACIRMVHLVIYPMYGPPLYDASLFRSAPPSGVPFSVRLVGETAPKTAPKGGPSAPSSVAAATPAPAPCLAPSVARSKPWSKAGDRDASEGVVPAPNRATETVAPSDARGNPKASVGESEASAAASLAAVLETKRAAHTTPVLAPADSDHDANKHLKEELKSVKTALVQQTEAAAAAMQVSRTTAAENTRLKAEIDSLKKQLAAANANANATPPLLDRVIGVLDLSVIFDRFSRMTVQLMSTMPSPLPPPPPRTDNISLARSR